MEMNFMVKILMMERIGGFWRKMEMLLLRRHSPYKDKPFKHVLCRKLKFQGWKNGIRISSLIAMSSQVSSSSYSYS